MFSAKVISLTICDSSSTTPQALHTACESAKSIANEPQFVQRIASVLSLLVCRRRQASSSKYSLRKHVTHPLRLRCRNCFALRTCKTASCLQFPRRVGRYAYTGRLYETCLTLLNGADIQFKRAHRLDVALVKNLPIALVFLPAADIPHFVANGDVDLGVTGHDMVQEAGPAISSAITEELTLGFGKCQLQVQIPENSDTIKSVEDLVGTKVATSFDHLAGKYFEELEQKLGAKEKTKIAYLNGSVETACALGLADGIGTYLCAEHAY